MFNYLLSRLGKGLFGRRPMQGPLRKKKTKAIHYPKVYYPKRHIRSMIEDFYRDLEDWMDKVASLKGLNDLLLLPFFLSLLYSIGS